MNALLMGWQPIFYDPNIDALNDWYGILNTEFSKAIVCCPPQQQHEMVLKCFDAGLSVLCEKPCGMNVAEARQLETVASDRDLDLYVGHQMRFLPSLQKYKLDVLNLKHSATAEMVGHVRFGYDIRKWHTDGKPYTTRVGILLECSHELDYVMWLMDGHMPSIKNIEHMKYDPLFGQAECESIFALYWHDVVVRLSLDYISGEYRRGCNFNNGVKGAFWIFHQDENDQAYKDELKDFLEGPSPDSPICRIEEMVQVHQVIEQIKET
jgi:predicted dehydrogenase